MQVCESSPLRQFTSLTSFPPTSSHPVLNADGIANQYSFESPQGYTFVPPSEILPPEETGVLDCSASSAHQILESAEELGVVESRTLTPAMEEHCAAAATHPASQPVPVPPAKPNKKPSPFKDFVGGRSLNPVLSSVAMSSTSAFNVVQPGVSETAPQEDPHLIPEETGQHDQAEPGVQYSQEYVIPDLEAYLGRITAAATSSVLERFLPFLQVPPEPQPADHVQHVAQDSAEPDPNDSDPNTVAAEEPDEPLIQCSSRSEPLTAKKIKRNRDGVTSVVPSGKRIRTNFTLRGWMYRKHPILKFFATGPLDRDSSPNKWWCRVCRVELSLRTKGALEVLSHYKTDSHLVKEHRIRMETPGLPLFDKDENELSGQALIDARKKAKSTHPLPPSLDVCHLRVGQECLPSLDQSASPFDKLVSQVSILEQGLRHGGHLDALRGLWESLSQCADRDQIQAHDWTSHRVFVSIFFLLLHGFV